MVMVLLSNFLRYWRADGRTYGQSRDNEFFLDRLVTRFSKVWAPLARRSSANNHVFEYFYYWSLSISFLNSDYVAGCALTRSKDNRKPSSGRRKGGYGRLIELAGY